MLHHPPFTSTRTRTLQPMLADTGYTGIATAAEAIETRYTGPRQWWTASWSQAPRIPWQDIPPSRRKAARTPASPPPEGPAQ